jgi:hypothetical protein
VPHSAPATAALSQRAARFPWYGYAGLAAMLISEFFMLAKIDPFYNWFTPFQWTGYIFFLDALLVRLRRESFIFDHTKTFLAMLLVSDIFWFMFEGYNLHLRNWEYVNLPENVVKRALGLVWAFATVYPGVLMTSEVLDEFGAFRNAAFGEKRGNGNVLTLPHWLHTSFIVIGVVFCAGPLLAPGEIAKYLFVFVWLGFFFLLDSLNYRAQRPSLLRAFEQGSARKLLSLFAAGLICGVLWEFWNYWAGAKWVYTVPYFSEPKIFEMPLYGFLGFLAFAVECYVMWHFAQRFLPERWRDRFTR